MKTLGQHGIAAFERRNISVETAVRFEIYTANRNGDGVVVPDHAGNIVVFPFLEHGAVVNEKFRAPGKKFWQRQGGRQTFWNSDALDDPALETGQMALTICEGELDALTAIDCGWPLAVSVPAGAPPARFDGGAARVVAGSHANAPSDDASGNYEYLWNNRDRLKRVRRFILAVDSDAPGRRLAEELVRRLSAARCCFVEYPAPCKDLNDVRMNQGAEAVAAVLNGARPYPVRGLYHLADYPDAGPVPAVSTGWFTLDAHMRLFAGEFMVISGIPGHGKSSFALHLLCNLAQQQGWRSAIFSPEMPTVPHLRDKLRKIVGGAADAFINTYFSFIDADPLGREDIDFDLDWLIDKATDAVLRDGIRVFLIDPWNEIEHARRRDETMTEYIGRGIRALKRFARLYQVAVIVVNHPTKDVMGRDGKARPPTLYDCEGSAHWFNKADHGVIIDRPNGATNDAVIRVCKVRFEETGTRGECRMRYDGASCRFETLLPPPDNDDDDKGWLK